MADRLVATLNLGEIGGANNPVIPHRVSGEPRLGATTTSRHLRNAASRSSRPMNAFNSPRDRAQLLVVVLGVAIAIALLPFAAGLLGALVLYVAVAPVYRRLLAFLPRRASAAGVVVAATVLILVPLAWLLVIAIGQAPAALRQLQASDGLARLAAVRIGSVDVGTRVVAAGGELVSWASAQAFRALGGAVRGTLNMVVAL